MAKQSTLTRADYLERRASQDVLLSEARAHLGREAYRLEMGDGDEADVKLARSNVQTLEDRISALDEAWKHAQETYADDLAAADVEDRKKAAAIIDKAIVDRASTIARIVNQIEPIRDMIREIEVADGAIVESARPFLTPRETGELRLALNGFAEIHTPVIASCLMRAGAHIHAMRASIDTLALLDDGLEQQLARSERIIRGAIQSILHEGA